MPVADASASWMATCVQEARNTKTPARQGLCELMTVFEESRNYPARIRTNEFFQVENAFPAEFRAQTGQIEARLENGAAASGADALVAGLMHSVATDADLRRLAAVWGRLSPDDRRALASHAETLAAVSHCS
ncbi:hypothetical protein [Planctopirus limnophila]|uniref:hypothetical protein n=1 Tax=Planctopirus limnophila TaxID=120 RepID=UPI0001A2FD57|nr:hypothetical protein [Planctopirus limnophila]